MYMSTSISHVNLSLPIYPFSSLFPLGNQKIVFYICGIYVCIYVNTKLLIYPSTLLSVILVLVALLLKIKTM